MLVSLSKFIDWLERWQQQCLLYYDYHTTMFRKSKNRIFYGWIIVAGASGLVSLIWGCDGTYGIFLPELATDLGWTNTVLSGAYSMGWIVANGLGIIAGRANDKYGPRLVITFSVAVTSVGFGLLYLTKNPWQLYLYYGLIANIGMGFLGVPVMSTVSHWFVKKRGMALGITQAGVGFGAFVMPPLVQMLITRFGWRISYLIIAGVILGVGLPVSRLMRLDPAEKGLRPDGAEAEIANAQGEVAVTNSEGFSFRQALRTTQLWLLFAIYVISSLRIGVAVHLKAYMVSFNIPEMTAATIIGIRSGARMVGTLIISKLSDRIGRRRPLVICFTVIATMSVWLIFIREPWQFYAYSIASGLFGAGSVLLTAMVADWFGMKANGSILGLLYIATGIGASTAPLLIGYLVDTRGDYQLAFTVLAIAALAPVLLSFALKRPEKGDYTIKNDLSRSQ